MDFAAYDIASGDYENAGQASKQLKEMLKRLGADPRAVRRTMIAAYEAEMNVVIHAGSGILKAAVDPEQVDVAVIDQGPGIPDIELAMSEGYSTAPAAARELGFGAGMGLPNIRKNTDRFSIQSEPNRGTHLRFTILLQPHEPSAAAVNSVSVREENCRLSLRCVQGCPLGAIRVRGGRPSILEHLCVDCTACMGTCPVRVFGMDCPPGLPSPTPEAELVVPAAFFEQFGPSVSWEETLQALESTGFHTIHVLEHWEKSLREAVSRYSEQNPKIRPLLSPVCPAVLNLIQVRFPSLLEHVAPFLSPLETAREELDAHHLVFMPSCPSQVTLLTAPSAMKRIELVSPASLRNMIQPSLRGRGRKDFRISGVENGLERLEIWGLREVMRFLDYVENGLMNDCGVVELYACGQGCFGSPVWATEPFSARRRFHFAWPQYLAGQEARDKVFKASALRRLTGLRPRGGVRLDADMAKAMVKLSRIDQLTRTLPGRDCGVCGAPSCALLAEDIVLDQAETSACPYLEDAERVSGTK